MVARGGKSIIIFVKFVVGGDVGLGARYGTKEGCFEEQQVFVCRYGIEGVNGEQIGIGLYQCSHFSLGCWNTGVSLYSKVPVELWHREAHLVPQSRQEPPVARQ